MQKKISKVLEKCMFKVENVNSKYNVNIENINIKYYIPACLIIVCCGNCGKMILTQKCSIKKSSEYIHCFINNLFICINSYEKNTNKYARAMNCLRVVKNINKNTKL